jgi:hypothetical protein
MVGSAMGLSLVSTWVTPRFVVVFLFFAGVGSDAFAGFSAVKF